MRASSVASRSEPAHSPSPPRRRRGRARDSPSRCRAGRRAASQSGCASTISAHSTSRTRWFDSAASRSTSLKASFGAPSRQIVAQTTHRSARRARARARRRRGSAATSVGRIVRAEADDDVGGERRPAGLELVDALRRRPSDAIVRDDPPARQRAGEVRLDPDVERVADQRDRAAVGRRQVRRRGCERRATQPPAATTTRSTAKKKVERMGRQERSRGRIRPGGHERRDRPVPRQPGPLRVYPAGVRRRPRGLRGLARRDSGRDARRRRRPRARRVHRRARPRPPRARARRRSRAGSPRCGRSSASRSAPRACRRSRSPPRRRRRLPDAPKLADVEALLAARRRATTRSRSATRRSSS